MVPSTRDPHRHHVRSLVGGRRASLSSARDGSPSRGTNREPRRTRSTAAVHSRALSADLGAGSEAERGQKVTTGGQSTRPGDEMIAEGGARSRARLIAAPARGGELEYASRPYVREGRACEVAQPACTARARDAYGALWQESGLRAAAGVAAGAAGGLRRGHGGMACSRTVRAIEPAGRARVRDERGGSVSGAVIAVLGRRGQGAILSGRW